MKRHILWSVTVATLTLGSCAGILLFTERGLRWSLEGLTRLSAERILVEQAEGRWLGPIHLHGVHLRTKSLTLHIRDLALDWQVDALLGRQLHIRRLHVSGITLNKLTLSETIDPIIPPHWPIDIRIDQPVVSQFRFARKGEPVFSLTEGRAGALLYTAHRLTMQQLTLTHRQGKLLLDGVLSLGDQPTSAIEATWQLTLPGLPRPLRGASHVTGTLAQLRSAHRLSGPFISELQGEINLRQTNFPWQASADLPPLQLRTLHAGLPALLLSGQVKGKGDLKRWQLDTQARLNHPLYGPWQATFSTLLQDGQWRIGDAILAAQNQPARLRGSGTWESASGQWQFKSSLDNLDTQAIRNDWPKLQLNGQFSGQGKHQQARFGGETQLAGSRLGQWHARFNASRAGNDWRLSRLTLQAQDHPARLDLQGRWQGGPNQATPLQLQARWRSLGWPLRQPAVSSPEGALSLSGSLTQYQLEANLALLGPQLPMSDWQLTGRGDRQSLRLDSVSGNLLDGQWLGQAALRWQPQTDWTARLAASQINLARQWPDWPSNLGLSMSGKGNIIDGMNNISIQLERLMGRVRDQPVLASAGVVLAQNRLSLDRLEAQVAHGHLTASGSLASGQLDGHWQLAMPDISRLFPSAKGNLNAHGTLTGPREHPLLQANLQARQLHYRGHQVEQLAASLTSAIEPQAEARLHLDARQLKLGGAALPSLSLEGTGNLAAHALEITTSAASEETLRLGLQGHWQDDRWLAHLRHGELISPKQGRWQAGASDLIATTDQFSLAPWCWRSDNAASVCLSATPRDQAGWDGKIALNRFDLGHIRPWLPAGEFRLSGLLSGHAVASFNAYQLLTADADIQALDGDFNFPVTRERWHLTPYRRFNARIFGTSGHLQAEASLELKNNDRLQLSAQLPDWDPAHTPWREQPLAGTLQVSLKDLSLFQEWVPDLGRPQGHLHGALTLGGTLGRPGFGGQARLEHATAAIPRLGIALSDINIHLDGPPGETIKLQASVNSGPGKLTVNGALTPTTLADWTIKLDAHGEQFEVARLPQARVLASPDLSYHSDKSERRLEGQVLIPDAFIVLPEGETTLTHSADVVVTDAPQTTLIEPATPLHYQVQIGLGDLVRLRGYGFSGRLNGTVVVEDSPRGDLAYGELTILDGEYKAYGQKLRIEQGRLLFPGGPLDNPGINVRAVRSDLNRTMIAGVRVTGFLRSPELRLFSTPAMDEADILAYLLLGRPLKLASAAEGDMLYQAASGIGLAGSELLAGRIAQRLAIDELRVQSSLGASSSSSTSTTPSATPTSTRSTLTPTQQTSVVLGKYLSPRLYVRYAYGIGQTPSVLYLRYQLSSHWSLETAGGNQVGTDLRYSLEH